MKPETLRQQASSSVLYVQYSKYQYGCRPSVASRTSSNCFFFNFAVKLGKGKFRDFI